MADEPNFIDLPDFREYTSEEMLSRANSFYHDVKRRRTVREFSDRPVDPEVINQCILAAGTAPSGANLQPWHFVIIRNIDVKHKIRVAAEEEEREFYENRATPEWLDALAPLGTDANKPFLETAPYLIAIFRKIHDYRSDGSTVKHYYSSESVGIATGVLITALHHCGLATLTHTPSPMIFLNHILDRPNNERPFLLLVVGYPTADAKVPAIEKKNLAEIATVFD